MILSFFGQRPRFLTDILKEFLPVLQDFDPQPESREINNTRVLFVFVGCGFGFVCFRGYFLFSWVFLVSVGISWVSRGFDIIFVGF